MGAPNYIDDIVNLNMSVQAPSEPDRLQQTGVIVSVGGTNTDPGTLTLIQTNGSLSTYLSAAIAINTLVWATGTATLTSTAAHGLPVGEEIYITIAGVTPAAWNGTYLATITGASTLTFAKTPDPGAMTLTGTFTLKSRADLVRDVATWFGCDNVPGIYILELGANGADAAIAYLTQWLGDNPATVYGLKVPDTWKDNADFVTLVANNSAVDSWLYFFLDVLHNDTAIWADYAALKGIALGALSPTETANKSFAVYLLSEHVKVAPSETNQITQTAYSFVPGFKPFPRTHASIPLMLAANINYPASGAEGNIANTILKMGVFMDGAQMSRWYAIDWIAINAQIELSASIINNSNNAVNPYRLDQFGIESLLAVTQNVLSRGIRYGMYNNQSSCYAIDFKTYYKQNPSDYDNGIYNGLYALLYTSQGFLKVQFNGVVLNGAGV